MTTARDFSDDALTDIFHLAGHLAISRCADYGVKTETFTETEHAGYRARSRLQGVVGEGADVARDYCFRYKVPAKLNGQIRREAEEEAARRECRREGNGLHYRW